MKKLSIMEPIDNQVIKLVDALKDNEHYQKGLEAYGNLEEHQQNIAKGALMALAILVPLLFVGTIKLYHSSVLNNLETKKEIIRLANGIISQSNNIKSESRKALGAPIDNESMFKSRVNSTLSSSGIDTSKVRIQNIDVLDDQGVVQISGKVAFTGFSSANLYAFVSRLVVGKKFKVEKTLIKKNTKNNLLDGHFDVLYFSRSLAADN